MMNARLAASLGGVVAVMACSIASADGDIVVRNAASSNATDIAERRAEWLADCGVVTPTHVVDFESGFVDGQNVSGVPDLFPGGLIITDSSSTHVADVRTGAVFGGSRPNGHFGLRHNEKPYLEMSFPSGVDGFCLSDIDHTGVNFILHHADGSTSEFAVEGTSTGGVSGELIGVWRNDRAPILRVQMDASGDGPWGIDDIMFVHSCRADFNGDGFINGADYDVFAELFESGGAGADFNGDGFINGDDYDAFAGVFEAGC